MLLLLLFSPFCTYEPTFRIHPSKLYDAKYLRNQLHPATPNFAASLHFTKENLDKLRQDLFGPDGILYCCQVGRQLYEKTKDEH